MILNIVSNYKVVSDLENMVVSTGMLTMPTTHLFIASNKWSSAIVEVSNKIPAGTLSNLHTVCDEIKVILPEVCTEHEMRILAELFPRKAGTIRKSFLLGKDLKGVVPCVEPN